MKILITTPTLQGGVSNYFSVLSKYLSVKVEFFHVGSRTQERKLPEVSRLIRDYKQFVWQLRNNDYDIVHVNPSLGFKAFFRDALFLFIARLFDKHTVVLIHGWSMPFERVVKSVFYPILKTVYFHSDAIIVLGEEFKRTLARLGFKKSLYKLIPPVDDDLLVRVDEDSIHNKYDSNQLSKVLFLARVHKDKGIYTTVQAMAFVQQDYPEAHLTIAGSGPEIESVVKVVDRLRLAHCEFLGHVSGQAKAEAFWQADVYVLPTTTAEGIPTSLLEAMAFGLPVVTRPAGGIKDFFENDKMGFLTESTDPEQFAKFIKRLLGDRQRMKEIGVYNHQYAMQNFLASDVARKMELIYRGVLNGKYAEEAHKAL